MNKTKPAKKNTKKLMKKNVHKPNIARKPNIDTGPGPALESFIALRNSLVDEQKAAAKAVVEAQLHLNKFDVFFESLSMSKFTSSEKQSLTNLTFPKKVHDTSNARATSPKRKIVSAKARTKTRLVDYIYSILKEKGPMSIRVLPKALADIGHSIDHSVDPCRLVSVTIGDHRSMFVRCGGGVWRVRDGRKKES